MTEECITPLRQRMIDDMSLRHIGEKTQKDYIRAVKNLAIFLQRSPDTASIRSILIASSTLSSDRPSVHDSGVARMNSGTHTGILAERCMPPNCTESSARSQ